MYGTKATPHRNQAGRLRDSGFIRASDPSPPYCVSASPQGIALVGVDVFGCAQEEEGPLVLLLLVVGPAIWH